MYEETVGWKLEDKTYNDLEIKFQSLVTTSLFKDWFIESFIPEAELYCVYQLFPFKVTLNIEKSSGHSLEIWTLIQKLK